MGFEHRILLNSWHHLRGLTTLTYFNNHQCISNKENMGSLDLRPLDLPMTLKPLKSEIFQRAFPSPTATASASGHWLSGDDFVGPMEDAGNKHGVLQTFRFTT